jgi:hypothetical protein
MRNEVPINAAEGALYDAQRGVTMRELRTTSGGPTRCVPAPLRPRASGLPLPGYVLRSPSRTGAACSLVTALDARRDVIPRTVPEVVLDLLRPPRWPRPALGGAASLRQGERTG